MTTRILPKGWLEATGDAGQTGVRCAFRFRLWQSQRRYAGEHVLDRELTLAKWPESPNDSQAASDCGINSATSTGARGACC